jgi:hypothetical protein
MSSSDYLPPGVYSDIVPKVGNLYECSYGTILLLKVSYGNPKKKGILEWGWQMIQGNNQPDEIDWVERKDKNSLMKLDFFSLTERVKKSLIIEVNSFGYFFGDLKDLEE